MDVVRPLHREFEMKLLATCPPCHTEGFLKCRNWGAITYRLDPAHDSVACACGFGPPMWCDQDHDVAVPRVWDVIQAEASPDFRKRLIAGMKNNSGIDPDWGYLIVWNQQVWIGNHEAPPDEHALQRGFVTFLFTDIADSTPKWDAHPAEMGLARRRQSDLISQAVAARGG